mmetsp:Transcript_21247/g.63847  ORF Transcript_21247/g.63847 Transcript_21247/m.63847 type:complete len:229 (-) Transcript_21247:905-1591(-)
MRHHAQAVHRGPVPRRGRVLLPVQRRLPRARVPGPAEPEPPGLGRVSRGAPVRGAPEARRRRSVLAANSSGEFVRALQGAAGGAPQVLRRPRGRDPRLVSEPHGREQVVARGGRAVAGAGGVSGTGPGRRVAGSARLRVLAARAHGRLLQRPAALRGARARPRGRLRGEFAPGRGAARRLRGRAVAGGGESRGGRGAGRRPRLFRAGHVPAAEPPGLREGGGRRGRPV